LYFYFCAKNSIFKWNFNIVTEIGSLPYAGAAAPAAETASAPKKSFKDTAKTTLAKNIFKAAERTAGEITMTVHTFNTCKTKLIVGGFFLIISLFPGFLSG